MTEILKAVMTVIGILITSVLIPYIKTKVDAGKLEKLETHAEYAIRYAEMKYTKEQWKEKKEFVYAYILDKSFDLGLPLNEADIDIIVEGLVNLIKYPKGVKNEDNN